MNLSRSNSRARLGTLILPAMAGAAITAIGCAWPGTSHSVRFNTYQTEREMGRLPPLPTMANGLNQVRAAWDDIEVYDEDYWADVSDSDDRSKKIDSLWDRAEVAEDDGNLRLAGDLLNEYLEKGISQGRRNSAVDQLDALSALNQGSSVSAIKAYLDARRCVDSEKSDSCNPEAMLEVAGHDRNLRDNVAYLKAVALYGQSEFSQAATAFKLVATQFPRSEKRQAALFMTAVSTMKTSVTYIPESGNADYDESPERPVDQAWHDAFAAFQRVVSEYPRRKYANEARSWQAYLWLRAHDRAQALAQYYRLLADTSEEARVGAAFSLILIRSCATEDEIARVENDLADEPQAALAYAYHNIYNYSIDPDSAEPPYDSKEENIRNSKGEIDYEAQYRRDDERNKEWQKHRQNIGHRELQRTLDFSKKLMAKYPDLSVGGAFALRAAQASEELGDNEMTIQFAGRALQSRLNPDERKQALWTLGVAEHRLHHFDAARKNLTTLLHDYPASDLTEPARRILAMVAEDAGDLDAALEQYIALNYDIDVAYFVDMLMTPEQLAAFIEKHPGSPKQNEFTYALGMRYLRQSRWDEARRTFAQVRTSEDSRFIYYCSTCNCNGGETTNCVDPKNESLGLEADATGKKPIPSALVMRDVQTANDLEALHRAATEAVGDEEKAEALYQYASYQYEASSLLFYNPLASPGYYNLGDFAGQGRYRVSGESQLLFQSTQEHERLARALDIYLEIAKKFPRTRAARDALYTAAVCHERLANYNPYWRMIYENGLHAGERMVTYADVKAAYPNYQLPRGTFGWQPTTRTVNNGPGWAAAPKPPPRLTRRERVLLFMNLLKEHLGNFWIDHGKRWLTQIVMVFGLALVIPIARRNRKRLRARIARQRIEQAKQMVTYPWFELFWIDPEMPNRRERIRKFLQAKREEFIRLLRDRRSRPVLWRSIVSHAAVTGLALSLIWTVWFG